MFFSANYLEREMGVNKTIGRFFVDRKLPENNSFWEGRFLYVSFGNGFVSIPVYYDLLQKIGLPADVLLEENHIRFMEQLMHFAMLHEKNKVSKPEELKCIRDLLTDRVQNPIFYEGLTRYLDQPVWKPLGSFGLRFPSLNRADVFLYILCDLPLKKEQLEQATRYWYALHPIYLIMDDIRDYKKDKEEGEENVVLDLGGGPDGFEKAFDLMQKNCETLEEINPLLGQFLRGMEEDLRKFIPVNIL